jgi:hypothetical protein
MAYREISLPTVGESSCTFEYVIGRWNTKIKGIGVFENKVIGSEVRHPDRPVKIAVTPRDIQREILMSEKCPPHVKNARAWDKPPFPGPKKTDPGPRTRGFAKLVGVEIDRVEASTVNQVILHGTDGSRFVINAETGIGAIPIMTCSQECLSDPDYD